jgi:hypothetical protein
VPAHPLPTTARLHLGLTHGFEVASTTTEADAATAHDALPEHYHTAVGDPVWAEPLGVGLLPEGAPAELRTIARLSDPAERVGAWKRQIERYNELVALCARQRLDDVGRVFQQTVVDGFRTRGTPGSWPEVDRRLGLNPGRAYRIWRGNE